MIHLPLPAGFWLGVIIALLGCLLIYLASPNQRFRAVALGRGGRWAGMICLLGALSVLLAAMAPAAAVATWGVALMLGFIAWPLIAAFTQTRTHS